MKKRSFLSVLLAVCVIIAMFSLTGCSSKTIIDLSKCVSVKFTGFNGEGYAMAVANNDYILSLLGDKNNLTAASVLSSFSFDNISNNGKLSNGDIVTVRIKTNETALKNADVMAINTELTFAVEGLKEKPKLDIFADVYLKVTGTSPYCTVTANYTGTQTLSSSSFIVKSSGGDEKTLFKNGDKVTVSLKDSAKSFLEKSGIVEEISREYTVQSDSTYILSAEDLTAEQKSDLNKMVENYVSEQIEILRNNSDRARITTVISAASGYNKGTLAAKSCKISDIQNIKFNSAYAGIEQGQGAFGNVTESKYIYYFYDMDVSYAIQDVKLIENTSSCVFLVRLSEPKISSGKISYSKIAMGCEKDFASAYNNRGLSDFDKIS